MELHIKALQELTHVLDYVMPGVKKMFNSWNEANGKDKRVFKVLGGICFELDFLDKYFL